MNEDDDSPSVIGGHIAPMPTREEHHAAWRRAFIAYAVELDVLDEQSATELFEAGADDWDYSQNPRDALDDEMAYWNED